MAPLGSKAIAWRRQTISIIISFSSAAGMSAILQVLDQGSMD